MAVACLKGRENTCPEPTGLPVNVLMRIARASDAIGISVVMLDVFGCGDPERVQRRKSLYEGFGFMPRPSRQGTIAYLEPCWRRIAHDEPRSRALRTSVLQSRPERPRTRPIPAPEGSLA